MLDRSARYSEIAFQIETRVQSHACVHSTYPIERIAPPIGPLDLVAETQCSRHVASAQQVMRLRRGEGEMVQPRPGAIEEDNVVRIAFAGEEYAKELVAPYQWHLH